MKTAICFTGTGRSLKYTGKNIKKVLIDSHPDCDIFVHLADTEDAEYAKQYFCFDQVCDLIVEKDEVIDTQGLRWQDNWPAGQHSGPSPKQTYLNMLLSRKKCGSMLTEYSKKNNIDYDKVIFSRLDIEYFDALPTDMDLNFICVPDFHHFDVVQGSGCNDRFAASSYKNMKIYFELYDDIRGVVRMGHKLHGESTLSTYLRLRGLKIKKYPIRFTRIRPNGHRQDERLRNSILATRDY